MRRVASLLLALTSVAPLAPAQKLTIWWAQWDPADGLAKMGKAFEQETGIAVDVHQIPWPSYQNEVFLNFGKDRTDFDLVVGDSQWLGKAAESGWYLDLTDWLPTALDLDTIVAPAKTYLCQYPPGSGRYFAAPCETDAIGLAYRADWFADPKEKEAFQAQYHRELAPPRTWSELRDLAVFFHRPKEHRAGVVLTTGRGYDALTMGFEQLLYAFGGSWGDPKTFAVQGQLDGKAGVAGAEFLAELCRYGPPNATSSDYAETLASFTNGSCAMMLNYFAFCPAIVEQMGDKAAFAVVPAQGDRHVISLGGQGLSISAKIDKEQQERAKQFIAWFHRAHSQERWVSLPACFSADRTLLASEDFRGATPYNAAFADSIGHLQDFWNLPEYGELLAETQKHLGQFLDGQATAQAALTACAQACEKIFARSGRRK